MRKLGPRMGSLRRQQACFHAAGDERCG